MKKKLTTLLNRYKSWNWEKLVDLATVGNHQTIKLVVSTAPLNIHQIDARQKGKSALPVEKLGADHWGPTPNGKHILAVIDMLSKYPEVAITKDTSAEENIIALDEILSRHGFCDTLRTDNGPP